MSAPEARRRTHRFILALASSLAAGCQVQDDVDIPFLTDVLTLEATIQDDPAQEDFQLVKPQGIGVDAQGKMYLADEHALKVYGPDGKPIKLIGREGSGPGEFVGPASAAVGPTEYIAAIDNLWEANVFSPDGEFLNRIRYRTENRFRSYLQAEGFTMTMLNAVIPLDADHLLIDLFGMKRGLPDPYVNTTQLLYATPDTVLELCQYVDHGVILTDKNRNSTRAVEFQGDLLWTLPSTDRLIYTETSTHRGEGDGLPTYRLVVLDLETRSADTLDVPWEPVPVPLRVRNHDSIYVEQIDRSFELDPAVRDILQETEVYPPLKALLADGGIVFAFLFPAHDPGGRNRLKVGQEVMPHVADIVHLTTGELKARAEFPFVPDLIKGGRAYRLHVPTDAFPTVYTYRIDEVVYSPAPTKQN